MLASMYCAARLRLVKEMAARRKLIPETIRQEILLKGKRKCPICVTAGTSSPTDGSIAHLDRDSTNVDRDNLVFLCSEHHARLDRGELSADQIRFARDNLYASI